MTQPLTSLVSLILLIVLAGRGNLAMAQPEAAQKFTFKTPRGVEFDVTPAGLSAIRHPEGELARGSWSVLNGDSWFEKGPSPINVGDAANSTLERLDEHSVRVSQQRGDIRSVATYLFQDEDVIISTRVENDHPSAPLKVTGFGGLEFHFSRRPTGQMNEQHHSYFVAHGVSYCHPSDYSRIGGSYAEDGQIGVGVSPWRTGLMRTLILWDYTNWEQGQREKLPSRKLLYFAASPVPPRGAATFDLRLRVSPETDWQHLLQPYREHFQSTFGELQYKPDYRWLATEYLNKSQQAISRMNPYGFHDGHCRIDTPAGAAKFCDLAIPALRSRNGQGVIVWGQGGDEPRGGMYRPDFDVLPPEVAQQWPGLVKKFRDAGLRLGVTARPRELAIRKDWKQDQIILMNPDDPEHREMLWARFEKMIGLGCTAFYLDTFGDRLEDVRLMQWLRAKLGPDILTCCEKQCDAILTVSGGYSETTLEAAGNAPHYRLWSGNREWEIYQWLVPGCQLASRLYQVNGKPPAGIEPPERWFFQQHVTPLIPLGQLKNASKIGVFQKEFLSSSTTWADTPQPE